MVEEAKSIDSFPSITERNAMESLIKDNLDIAQIKQVQLGFEPKMDNVPNLPVSAGFGSTL